MFKYTLRSLSVRLFDKENEKCHVCVRASECVH